MWKRILLFLPVLIPLSLIAALIFGFVVVSGIREILPPAQITFAAGRPGGGYHAIAQEYHALLAADGIEVVILDTPGSMENARLLASGEADVALLQGGTPVADGLNLQAIAAVELEPFMVFHRPFEDRTVNLAEWGSLLVAAGEPGSGTRIAINNALQTLDLTVDQSRFLPIGGEAAATALLQEEVDLAVFVAPITAPYLEPLLTDPDIAIGTLRDGEALARQLRFMQLVDIPPAGLDYRARIPAERVELTAMLATLAIQGDLHPAVVNRLARAAQRIHAAPSVLSAEIELPSAEGTGLPMNLQARDVLSNPPGFLERVLPFWLAAQIARITLLIVPLLVLMVPLLRMVPGIYTWSIRSRIYRRYNELVAIDAEAEEVMTEDRRTELLARIDEMEHDAKMLGVPLSYQEHVFTLRVHIDLVRRRLLAARPA